MIKIKIPNANWAWAWYSKEEGSWEDSCFDNSHPASKLYHRGNTIALTKEEIKKLIKSGEYHSTAWSDDEINGGSRTKKAIANFCKKLNAQL